MDALQLEKEVLRIARMLWPEAEGGGAEMIDGRERDGVFITSEIVHLVECTISRTKNKAEHDVNKLVRLSREMRKKYPDKVMKSWFVTNDEPTADQRAVANASKVTAISFKNFQGKLIDVFSLLEYRKDYAFGSIRNPETGDFRFDSPFIPMDLVEKGEEANLWPVARIEKEMRDGKRIIVLGHYGVGKSMTLKEVYKKLKKRYANKQSSNFPIFLNLRDHHGQTDPVEALERHSRKIGFENPQHLVRAWRAGYVHLILDGFDEIAALGWADRASKLRDIRYRSMELIRSFINQSPKENGVLIAGRINFFDSINECKEALGLKNKDVILSLDDFTDEQVKDFFEKNNISSTIPDWVPSRPLLLGYLAAKGVIQEILNDQSELSPAYGWDFLLGEVSKREASMETGLSPDMVRQIIEKLACYTRKFESGLGPIYQKDLENVFYSVCGYPPDDRALVVLQRLPGLGPKDQQDSSRFFIDRSFAEVARSGEILRYVIDPFSHDFGMEIRHWQETLDQLGIQVLGYQSKKADISRAQLEVSVEEAQKKEAEALAADILFTIYEREENWQRGGLSLNDISIPILAIDDNTLDYSPIRIENCIINKIIIEGLDGGEKLPRFFSCLFGNVIGCHSENTLPMENFQGCIFDSFEDQKHTTAAILDLDLPTPLKVAFTILKKLYLQAGGGRRENSFYRGLSHIEQRYIPDVIKVLRQYDLMMPSKGSRNGIWLPVRAKAGYVKNLIWNNSKSDELTKKLERIK